MTNGGGNEEIPRGDPHTPTTETEETEYRVTVRRPKQQATEAPERPLTRAERIAVFIQGGLLAAAIVYASLQTWQLCEFRSSMALTRESNGIARRAMEADSRAWVLLDWVEGDPTVDHEIRLFLKNTGKTPAIYLYDDANLVSVTGELPYPPPALPEDARKYRSLGTLGPDQRLTSRVTIDPSSLESKAADIASGKINAFVYGYTLYWDEFGIQRGLTFCQKYQPIRKTWGFCLGFNMPW